MAIIDSLQAWAVYSHANQFWLFLVIGVGLAIAGFAFSFIFLYKARLIEDTPTSRVRSAAQGYVELSGRARLMDGPPVVAPLTTTPCVWYRFKVEHLGEKNDPVVVSGTSDDLFLLVDGDAQCVVDPDDGEVFCRTKVVWYEESYPSRNHRVLGGGMFGRAFGLYRYTEERLHPGEYLYVLGEFQSIGGGAETFNTREEVKALLKAWKQDRASLLHRFDANGDGEIDPLEWEQVRQTAVQEVRQHQLERSTRPLTHLIAKPRLGKRPFLVSVLPQQMLVRRYRYLAMGSLAGFLLLGSLAIWVLNLRFAY